MVLFERAPFPNAVLVLLFPPPRPTVIPFTRISQATSKIAPGVLVQIPNLCVSSSKYNATD